MGTRADFYVGRGKDAEWLGSIAYDGNPEEEEYAFIVGSANEATYRGSVAELLEKRDDARLPADGWPWPWKDSNTTDYAYAFDGHRVWVSNFGSPWTEAMEPDQDLLGAEGEQEFPDMSQRQGPLSYAGMIIMHAPRE